MIFSLIYNKRQTQLLLDCEYFQVLLRPPVLWVLGSDRVCNGMSSQAAVQVWASLPLLVLVLWAARSFWLPPCAPALLSTGTTSEGFVPTPQRCTACQLGISVFSFFFGLSSHALCHKSKSTCCHALHVSQRLWAAVQELRSACLEGMVSVTCGFCNAKSRN